MHSASRGYRGARGSQGKGRFQSHSNFTPSAKLQEGLSESAIDSVSINSIRLDSTKEVEATNVVALGSYDWVDHSIPTIVIPASKHIGAPPLWKEPSLPLQLEPDTGDSFIDQNTARLPMHPLEPMFRAISVTQEQFKNTINFSEEKIDVVTDRNSLRKLMRFIISHGPNRDHRPGSNREFRIDVQLALNGRTLVLTRHEENLVDKSTGFKGYGHNFEKATTEASPPLLATNSGRTHISHLRSTGHHRITRYDLLGLRFLVRYEVDSMESTPKTKYTDIAPKDELDELTAALAQTSLLESKSAILHKPKLTPKKPESIVDVPQSELRHVIHGTFIPQDRVLELRTIKSIFQERLYPQLFLSQTPVLKLAKQLDGRIDAIQVYDKEIEEMKEAHNRLAPEFATLVELLKQIRGVAKKRNLIGHDRPFALYWSGKGDLKVHTIKYGYSGNLLSAKELWSLGNPQ
ncbi:geranylgeranyl pyrophosphate synthetase [Rhizoctonia solani]|uniref:Geranylgeranyl pyrophosphate synthetase n=1 Tax=Rhizoctonia solani TaxID=456999 RepID=A0A8H7IGL4_9AGAM|nr:geranylgeranyl pyrophosphate synthetase [Rhizoctonia solani]